MAPSRHCQNREFFMPGGPLSGPRQISKKADAFVITNTGKNPNSPRTLRALRSITRTSPFC